MPNKISKVINLCLVEETYNLFNDIKSFQSYLFSSGCSLVPPGAIIRDFKASGISTLTAEGGGSDILAAVGSLPGAE